jgi:hypothetical protein
MIRSGACWLSLFIGVVLVGGCDLMFPPPGDGRPTVNVYGDRYEFRLRRYDSIRTLRIGLDATVEVPMAVEVHDCEGRERLAPVLDLLRERGLFDLDISMPQDCVSGLDIGELGPGYTVCEAPRPDVCTREFRPVCAQRDTGTRCVTTPCDSIEAVDAGNACTACSDPAVYGYYPGRCEAP